MLVYRRRLPHIFPDRTIIFTTWRLAGSGPPDTPEILTAENTGRIPSWGQPFDRSIAGPLWLRDARIAQIVQDTIRYGAAVQHSYDLYAWAIMPNHVHVVWEPHIPMPAIMRWLKGRTSRVANRVLARSGAFWQDESYDHWIRSPRESDDVICYVESNPVAAGMVSTAANFAWSSARFRTDETRRSYAPL
jgi:REP element-mobilizing transposase RayT